MANMDDRYDKLMLDIDVLCYNNGFRKLSNISVQDLKTGSVVDMFDSIVEINEEKDIPKVIKSKNLEIGSLKCSHTAEVKRLKKEIEQLKKRIDKYEKKEYAKRLSKLHVIGGLDPWPY